MPKLNGIVRLCLDSAILIYRGLMLNDILPRLEGMKYLMLIDVSVGYHNLKIDDK